MLGYAPATAQLTLKPGEAGWVYCPQSALPIRAAVGNINLTKIPMWELARLSGQGNEPGKPRNLGGPLGQIVFNVPTGCRIELEPETELDKLTYAIAMELEQKANIVPTQSAEQQQLISYGERKKNLQTVDRDSTIPDAIKRKYYEYLKKELLSISEELPLIRSLASKCSDYLTDRSAEIAASWEKIDEKFKKAERHAKKRMHQEKSRNELWKTMNTVGGIALSAIPVVGTIVSLAASTAVSMVNAKYNSDQLNKMARNLGQAYDKILYEEQPEALNQLDEAILRDGGACDAIYTESGFFTEAKAVESRLLLNVEKLKRGIWDTDDLLASLGTTAQPTVTATTTPPWLKWAALGGAALILYYLL